MAEDGAAAEDFRAGAAGFRAGRERGGVPREPRFRACAAVQGVPPAAGAAARPAGPRPGGAARCNRFSSASAHTTPRRCGRRWSPQHMNAINAARQRTPPGCVRPRWMTKSDTGRFAISDVTGQSAGAVGCMGGGVAPEWVLCPCRGTGRTGSTGSCGWCCGRPAPSCAASTRSWPPNAVPSLRCCCQVRPVPHGAAWQGAATAEVLDRAHAPGGDECLYSL